MSPGILTFFTIGTMDQILGKILRYHGEVNRRDDDMSRPATPSVDRRAQMSDVMVREQLTARLRAPIHQWRETAAPGGSVA